MKVKEFVKKYAATRSDAKVTAFLYYRNSGDRDRVPLGNRDLIHMGEKWGPNPEVAEARLESFEIKNGEAGAELLIYCSMEG